MQELNLKKLNIDYDEATHTYSKNGKLFAGVSSVSELAKSKQFNGILNQWSANCVVDYIKDVAELQAGKRDNGLFLVSTTTLDEARYSYKNKSNEAKETGTDLHQILEEYIKNGGNTEKRLLSDFQLRAFVQFVQWEKENKVEWLASELLVGDEDREIAGRLDALALVNGKKTIVDFKVANQISPSYFLQTAGYGLCLEWMGFIPEQRLIIRLPKTEKMKKWNEVIKKSQMVENNLEAIYVPTDYEFDKEAFLHFREGYKWLNQQLLNN